MSVNPGRRRFLWSCRSRCCCSSMNMDILKAESLSNELKKNGKRVLLYGWPVVQVN